jgi:hypothetical protein
MLNISNEQAIASVICLFIIKISQIKIFSKNYFKKLPCGGVVGMLTPKQKNRIKFFFKRNRNYFKFFLPIPPRKTVAVTLNS